MTANYACPSCDGRLLDAGARAAWRCRRCGEIVVERARGRMREFYRRATGRNWSGLR